MYEEADHSANVKIERMICLGGSVSLNREKPDFADV